MTEEEATPTAPNEVPDPSELPSDHRYETRVGGYVEIGFGDHNKLAVHTDSLSALGDEPIVFESRQALAVSLLQLKNAVPFLSDRVPNEFLGVNLETVKIQLDHVRLTSHVELGIRAQLLFESPPSLAGVKLSGFGLALDHAVVPVIRGVEPTSAAVGDDVVLVGTHLDQLDASVTFETGGRAELIGDPEFSRLQVRVPSGAASGTLTLSSWLGDVVSPVLTVS